MLILNNHMDSRKAEFCKAATTNLFHHNQAFHDDYGLVWHDGRTVFLSPVQSLSDGNQPNIHAYPPLPLGKFDDDILDVAWSRDKTGIHGDSAASDGTNFLCVQHLDYVSVWTVSGRASHPKCNKVTHHNVKSLPQGCLWHPRKAVLCVVSHTDLHVYNALTASWDVTQCDGKVAAGCWGRDGSKFFLALGSEVKVLEFNTQTQSLELAVDRTKTIAGTRFDSLQSTASIKTMIPVTDELIAIATDLPLDHLIYQSNQESPRHASLMNPRLNPPSSASVDRTQRTDLSPAAVDHTQRSEFSLIIPKERIVQNPIATMFKEDFIQQGTLEDNVKILGCTDTADGSCSQDAGDAVAHHQEEDRDRGADTVGDKLDQILNLMKKMDVMPKDPGRHEHPENGAAALGGLRSQLETKMKDEGRSGPIDVMALMNETDVKTSLRLNERTGKVANHHESVDDCSDTDSTARTGVVNRTESHNFAQSDEHKVPGTSMGDVIQTSRLDESETRGRLPAAKLAGQDSSVISTMQGGSLQSVEKVDVCMTGQSELFEIGDGDASSGHGAIEADDVIDLTGLKFNGTNDSLSKMVDTQQRRKPSSPDAAKLTILNMSSSNEPVTVTSVDLQGILTPYLLHFQESSQCFVVGTNTQRCLLVYRWHNNELKPAKQNIMLPDSHRPLGVCDIPGDPTHILVLAGETPPTDGAFLSFSSKTEMNLKWFKYELPADKSATCANTSAFSNTTFLAKDYPMSSTPVPPNTVVKGTPEASSEHLPSRLESVLPSHEVTSTDQCGVSESLTPEMACQIMLSFHQGHTVPEDQVTAARIVLQSKTPYQGHTMPKPTLSPTEHKETAAQNLIQSNPPNHGHTMVATTHSLTEDRESTARNLRQFNTSSQGHTMPETSSSSAKDKETAVHMLLLQSNIAHPTPRMTTSPVTGHHHDNRLWASRPRCRIQGGWSSSYASRMSRRDHQKESVVRKYPSPEDADVVHLVCQAAENEQGVLKTFLLNHQMLKLQVVKDAFGFNSVEMKIGDKWVVLTEDSEGCIPICFPSNTKHTIRECNRTHHQGRI